MDGVAHLGADQGAVAEIVVAGDELVPQLPLLGAASDGAQVERTDLVEGTREALAASAEELARGLAVDREASELHRDWHEHLVPSGAGHIHRFHAPGSEALADRTAALEKRVAQPLEMPALLRMGLEDHRAMAEEWSRIRECRDDLARLAKRPEPGSEEWLRDARDAAGAARAILADGMMGRVHGLTGTPMGEEFEGNAAALGRELRIHDASGRLLRDWAEHAGAAAEEGLHPFHAPGYDALLDRIRDHEREAGKRMSESFLQVLLLARELKLLRVGLVRVDGSKFKANASKHRSVTYERAGALIAQLEGEIGALLGRAEAADAAGEDDPQALPKEIARREALRNARRPVAPSPLGVDRTSAMRSTEKGLTWSRRSPKVSQ